MALRCRDEVVAGAVFDPVHGARVASAEVTDVVAANGLIHEELLAVLEP